MTKFHFRTTDLDATLSDEQGYEFPDLPTALNEAKRLLAEMALDGLPDNGGSLRVDLFNAQRVAIAAVAASVPQDSPRRTNIPRGQTEQAAWQGT